MKPSDYFGPEKYMETVLKLVNAAVEYSNNNHPHDTQHFKCDWVDVPFSLAVQCTFVPGHLQQEFTEGVVILANEIFRSLVNREGEKSDAEALKAIEILMPEIHKEIKSKRLSSVGDGENEGCNQ